MTLFGVEGRVEVGESFLFWLVLVDLGVFTGTDWGGVLETHEQSKNGLHTLVGSAPSTGSGTVVSVASSSAGSKT